MSSDLLGTAVPSCLVACGRTQACPEELAPTELRRELAVWVREWRDAQSSAPWVPHRVGTAAEPERG